MRGGKRRPQRCPACRAGGPCPLAGTKSACPPRAGAAVFSGGDPLGATAAAFATQAKALGFQPSAERQAAIEEAFARHDAGLPQPLSDAEALALLRGERS